LTAWKRILPLGVLIAIVAVFAIRNTQDLQEALRLFRSARPWPLAGAFAFQILYYLFATLTVAQCLRLVDFPQPFFGTLRATFLLIFVSRIVPGPAATGPAAMYFILGRRGLDRTRAAFVGPMFYAVDYAVFSGLLICGVAGAALRHQDIRGAAVGLPVLGLALGCAWVAIRFWNSPERLAAALCRLRDGAGHMLPGRFRLPESGPARVAAIVADMREHVTTHPGAGWKLAGAGTAMLLCDVATMSLCIIAFGPWLATSSFVLGFCLATLGAIVSFLPGGLGTFEVAMVLGFVGLGVPRPAALAATLAYRVIATWLPALLGLTAVGELTARGSGDVGE
jgi:uncharacterized membrane protein YbhN (UPF0104 family)